MKDKDIITKIKKAYEVKTPDIFDRLCFPQDKTVFTFQKRNRMSVRKVMACCACSALIIGAVTITAMHFNVNNDAVTPIPTPSKVNAVLDNQATSPNSTNSPDTDVPKLSYEIPYAGDYAISTDQMSMFNAADLVIEGVYGGTVSTSATDIGMIISTGKASSIKIIKGELAENELLISYYGGVMKVSEFREQVKPEYLLKYGFDKLPEEEADNKYIGFQPFRNAANPQQGLKYLMFLAYDETTGEYFVLCDGYGIREINAEGKVLNIDSSEYEQIYCKEMEKE